MNQLSKLKVSEIQQSKKSNYTFLKGSFPEMYRVSLEVENYYSTDYSCCLLKCRLFIELWCHEVGDILDLKPAVEGDLLNKIKQIEVTGRIPNYLISDLNEIRREANKGAHVTLSINGQWSSDCSLSKTKLKNLMISMYGLAKYLVYQLRKVSELTIQEWLEPESKHVEGELCHSALLGDKESAFLLAKSASSSMQLLNKANDPQQKKKRHILQRDLEYFLDKAHRLDHKGTYLEYANSYATKLLPCPNNTVIIEHYKNALKNDLTGESAFCYGSYLLKNNQAEKGLALIKISADKQYKESAIFLQEYYYKKDNAEYTKWISAGVEMHEHRSLLLDFESKLAQFEGDLANELLKKKAKSAFINVKAHQVKGIEYYQAYCAFKGYWGAANTEDENLQLMVNSYKQIPSFLHYETELFCSIVKIEKYAKTAILLSERALLGCVDIVQKAQMKFDFAMLIWKELLADKSVKTPLSMKKLIREAALEGSSEADQFVKSPKGKALLRDQSYVVLTTTKKQVDRKKQNSARKKARKAKRK